VEKKGSPVPILTDETGRPKSREQLEAYAMNCQKFLAYAESLQQDPEKNNDSYWTAATHWWKTRIECLTAAARKSKPVPPPRLPLKRSWVGEIPSSPSMTTTTKKCLTETAYTGEAWDTTPRSTPPSPTSMPSGLPVASAEVMCTAPTNLFATLMTEELANDLNPPNALDDIENQYKNL